MCSSRLIDRMLETVEQDVVPLTRQGVGAGNKVFGAAILRKSDLSLVIAGTNNETANPLWHGEIHTPKLLYEMPRSARPEPADCLFLSTHEPCSMCLSAITWAGYDNFHYLFSHEDSRDSFSIPHDLKIVKQVFTLDAGGYAKTNDYWSSFDLMDLIDTCDAEHKAGFIARVDALKRTYAANSEVYQTNKGDNEIPLK